MACIRLKRNNEQEILGKLPSWISLTRVSLCYLMDFQRRMKMRLFDWLSDYFSGNDAGPHMSVSDSGVTDDTFSSGMSPGGTDDTFSSSTGTLSDFDEYTINPVTGLPMVGGIGGIDVAGNPYGFDLSGDHLHFDSGTDAMSSSGDSFGSGDSGVTSSGDGFNDW
jgi:hypothetical protein